MTGIEPLLMKVGNAVVVPAVKRWLADRRRHDEVTRPLSELLNRRALDTFSRRRLEREIEAMADAVAQRLDPLGRAGTLPDNERRAALEAVVTAFGRVASDEEFFAADADGARLAARIRERAADVPDRAGLGEPARRLYGLVLDECCDTYAQAVVHLGSFAPRAGAEALSRLSGLGEQLGQVLSRLPVRTLDAPAGTGEDEQFRLRYLTQVSTTLDRVELFGIDARNYRPAATLSVAYISLAVSAERTGRRSPRDRAWLPGTLRRGDRPDADPGQAGSMRVEAALGANARTLMRGEAGSGKTTVVQWLAVTAARGGFTGELAGWNGYVPFLVRLRRHTDGRLPDADRLVAASVEAVGALEPPGWAHRQLASGRALLLVDGVDELPAGRRRTVREWLRGMLALYPDIGVVVTSRPAAAAERWLAGEGFAPTMLERMSPADVRALIAQWHRAVRDAGDLPCPVGELPRYESALVGRLDASPHLQALATSPLLCAMLCALNLDRRTHLPRDRMSLYAAAVDLLLERRDTERGIEWSGLALGGRDKLQLMQYLAWRMSINGEAESPQERAVDRLAERRAAMPHVKDEAQTIFEYLLHRSGLLRQPVPGRVDFVHRTFQEYLTAREAADRGDVGMLVEKAHLDSWRDVAVMAVGHANATVREELITRVLDRAGAEPAHRRTLRLLAASCLETAPSLPPPLLERVNAAIDALVPPRSVAEARSLSSVGEPLLRRLPASTKGLGAGVAAGTVRAAALVNGPEALAVLARYATDPREEVQRELIEVWEFFDPEEYARRVLADAPLLDGELYVPSSHLLSGVWHLRHLRVLDVAVEQRIDLGEVPAVPALRSLSLDNGFTGAFRDLSVHRGLTALTVMGTFDPSELRHIGELNWLRRLQAYPDAGLGDLSFARDLADLEWFGATLAHPAVDLAVVGEIPRLEVLGLRQAHLPAVLAIARLPLLRNLVLGHCGTDSVGLPELVDWLPETTESLWLSGCEWLDDLGPLSRLPALRTLHVAGTAIADLSPLASASHLTLLDIEECENITDLSPLAGLTGLRMLTLRGIPGTLDVTPLAGHRELGILCHGGQQLRGADRLGRGVRLLH